MEKKREKTKSFNWRESSATEAHTMERMMKEQMQELRRFLAEGKITEDQFAKNEEGLKAHYASMKAEAEEQTTLLINDATAGDAAAQWELGRAYLDGNGVEHSDEIGLAWYTKAAEAGHARAQCSVAVAHCNGRGTPMCRKTAAIWYVSAGRACECAGCRNKLARPEHMPSP